MSKRKNHSWLKLKNYTHFSSKLTTQDIPFIISYVQNHEAIEHHKFYPLIHKCIYTRRLKLKYDFTKLTKQKCHSFTNESGKVEGTGKCRMLYYAAHLDSQIYSYYSNEVLGKIYESCLAVDSELSKCITAYRKISKEGFNRNKNNIDFAKETFDEIKKQTLNRGECAAIALDISEFFDSLDHKILKASWLSLLQREQPEIKELPLDHYHIYKSLTKFAYVDFGDILKEFGFKNRRDIFDHNVLSFTSTYSEFRKRIVKKGYLKKHPFYKSENDRKIRKGIPQGTPISAFLANLYLLEFDKRILNKIQAIGGMYRRYSDDLVIVCPSNDIQAVKKYVMSIIENDFKLIIQEQKTQTSIFTYDKSMSNIQCKSDKGKEIPFCYLGFEFNGKCTRIRPSSLSKFYRGMKKIVGIKARRARVDAIKHQGKKTKRTDIGLIFKGPIFKRFSHLGRNSKKRNYFIYAKDAAFRLEDDAIRKQLRRSWTILNNYAKQKALQYNLPAQTHSKPCSPTQPSAHK